MHKRSRYQVSLTTIPNINLCKLTSIALLSFKVLYTQLSIIPFLLPGTEGLMTRLSFIHPSFSLSNFCFLPSPSFSLRACPSSLLPFPSFHKHLSQAHTTAWASLLNSPLSVHTCAVKEITALAQAGQSPAFFSLPTSWNIPVKQEVGSTSLPAYELCCSALLHLAQRQQLVCWATLGKALPAGK